MDLTLNDRKKNELQDWLKQVEAWLEAQIDDGFITKKAHSSGVAHGKMTAGGSQHRCSRRCDLRRTQQATFRRLIGGLAAEILHQDFQVFAWLSGAVHGSRYMKHVGCCLTPMC